MSALLLTTHLRITTKLYGRSNEPAKRGTNGVPRHSVNGVSPKFKTKTHLYRHFASLFGTFDFSDQAMLRLYNHESYGTPLGEHDNITNGYVIGKKWLNWHITNWKQGLLEGSLTRHDLLSDIPDVEGYKEMIDKVLNEAYIGQTWCSMSNHTLWWEVKPPE